MTTSLPSQPSQTINENKFKDIPNYEEYLELAKKNHWIPIDPIEKLSEISLQYSQIFSYQNYSQTNELLKLLHSESQFLFSVLKKSSHRQKIDLTKLFFDSIEGIHRGLYHIEKQILQNNKERFPLPSLLSMISFSSLTSFFLIPDRVVTRAEAEHYSKQYLYGFTTVLSRLLLLFDLTFILSFL